MINDSGLSHEWFLFNWQYILLSKYLKSPYFQITLKGKQGSVFLFCLYPLGSYAWGRGIHIAKWKMGFDILQSLFWYGVTHIKTGFSGRAAKKHNTFFRCALILF